MQPDAQAARRLMELATRAEKTDITQFSHFLSPAQQAQAQICAKKAGIPLFDEGGTLQAERRVVAFARERPEEWPIVCVQITWRDKGAQVGHRDVLGTLTGLGISRDIFGDIYLRDAQAHVFILRDMADYVAASLDRVGGTAVLARVLADIPEDLAEARGEEVRITVASPRLDAVLSGALHLSRGKAAALVASGRVQVNHREELRGDRQIAEGDVISIRGIGRVAVSADAGRSKKGRTVLKMLRF